MSRYAAPFIVRLFAALGVLLSALPVYAQGRPSPRPFESLFGGNTTSNGQSLDVLAGIGAASDSNSVTGGDLVGSIFNVNGFHTSLTSALSYNYRLDRFQAGASVGIDGRYYSRLETLVATNRAVDGYVDLDLGRASFALRHAVSASPVHYSELFPTLRASTVGDAGATLGVYTLGDLLALRHSSVASAGFRLTRRTTLEFDATNGFTDFGEGSAFLDERAYSVAGRLVQRFSRNGGVRFGYGYRKGMYKFDTMEASADLHDIDVGIDYNKALSLTRQTSLRFGATSTVFTSPATDLQNRFVYWLGGSVALSHEFGRSWTAETTYDRGARIVAGLAEPVFTNGVIARLSGALSRRAQIDTSVGISFGTVGFGQAGDLAFNTYTGQSRVQYAVSRSVALFGQYRYYNHDFGQDVVVPDEVPTFFGHHGVQAGLTVWVPLLRR